MKKYTLFGLLLVNFFFISNAQAQIANSHVLERNTIQREEALLQQKAAVNSEMQRIIFRFETAYEDKDVESTKILQNTLAELMQSALNYPAKQGEEMDDATTTMVKNFSNFQFDFPETETKEAVEMKGLPSEFMKLMNEELVTP